MMLTLLPEIIPELLALTDEASRAVMSIYASQEDGQNSGVVFKKDHSPLTEADLAAHQIIVSGLQRLTPNITVISEEDQEMPDRPLDGTFWLVDPLDGTKEFVSRNGEFTVNIALVTAHQAVFGIVAAPALELLYWGGQEIGAYRRMHATVHSIRVADDPVRTNRPVRVLASRSHMNAETTAIISALGTCDLAAVGSSLKFCRIAEGSADFYPRVGPTCEWDTAAGHAILEAAGGYVRRLDGEPLCYGKQEILNPDFIASALPFSLPAGFAGSTARKG